MESAYIQSSCNELVKSGRVNLSFAHDTHRVYVKTIIWAGTYRTPDKIKQFNLYESRIPIGRECNLPTTTPIAFLSIA